jgi:hypothetical protein
MYNLKMINLRTFCACFLYPQPVAVSPVWLLFSESDQAGVRSAINEINDMKHIKDILMMGKEKSG